MGICHGLRETVPWGEKLRNLRRGVHCLCRLRGEGAADCRNLHADLVENAALHHAADAAAAFAEPEPLRLPIPRRVSEACIAAVLTLDRFEFQAYAIAQALEPIACRLLFPVQSNHAG